MKRQRQYGGDVSVCLSQQSSLQAFHHHVVFCLSTPSLPPSFSGDIPVTAPLFSSSSNPPHPPHPSLLSGHPPCLFRWNRRGNESQSLLLTHSWDFGPTIVCTAVVFSLSASMLLMLILHVGREILVLVWRTG